MKLILNEDLFDDVDSFIVPEIEIEPIKIEDTNKETPEGIDIGVSNLLINAINDEWETIASYNDIIANLQNHEDMIPVIQDIVAEENKHVGQLQKILLQISPNVSNILQGEEEASQQMETNEEGIIF